MGVSYQVHPHEKISLEASMTGSVSKVMSQTDRENRTMAGPLLWLDVQPL